LLDGCVFARSNEAKALGIAMGEAWHICRKRVDTDGVNVRSIGGVLEAAVRYAIDLHETPARVL
jgi:hypothetical protein